jgi:hypothetical protein
MSAKAAVPGGTTAGAPQVLLAHHLKQLKLPTVLREYEKVARECARDGVDHALPPAAGRTRTSRPRAARHRTRDPGSALPGGEEPRHVRVRLFASIPSLNKLLVLERGATVVTSNLPFEEWPSVFRSERLTGALLDRLTHHVHILELNGESYRLKQSKGRRRSAVGAAQNQATAAVPPAGSDGPPP